MSLLLVTAAHLWLLAPLQLVSRAGAPPALNVSMIVAQVAVPRSQARASRPRPATRSRTPSAAPAAPVLAIAPSLQWHFRLRMKGQDGEACLHWERGGSGYRLRLDRRLAERTLPGWRSLGRLGASGLAPERYAELRGERDAKATNFRREEGLISFSSSSELMPLAEGVQDRLSWWLQLAALAAAGHDVEFPVAGTRGEPQAWRFEWQGVEQGLWHYRRAGQADWDGPLDVWLDPSQHRLPVRLQSGDPAQGGWWLERSESPLP